eukprot:TRINITY_DN14401_c0_g1_i1.p1 TRINITY_DN14401_c0_g1~~TRINITY_DN14401_c0_g1_i1.p1  ORF type:complete len:249 (-),score=22.45 TRINITY_DN14401_c0_g1_i1:497-1243(-)
MSTTQSDAPSAEPDSLDCAANVQARSNSSAVPSSGDDSAVPPSGNTSAVSPDGHDCDSSIVPRARPAPVSLAAAAPPEFDVEKVSAGDAVYCRAYPANDEAALAAATKLLDGTTYIPGKQRQILASALQLCACTGGAWSRLSPIVTELRYSGPGRYLRKNKRMMAKRALDRWPVVSLWPHFTACFEGEERRQRDLAELEEVRKGFETISVIGTDAPVLHGVSSRAGPECSGSSHKFDAGRCTRGPYIR